MISIFIPTYNGEKYLAKTLESLLAQSYRDFEVLCVDDASTDSTFSILAQYRGKDSRIKAFSKTHEGDVPHSWQFVFPLIKGEFTLYMSQDDLLAPDSLEKLIFRQKETNADAVLPVVVDYEEGKSIEEVHSYQGVEGDISKILSGKDAFSYMLDYEISGFALWRTELIKNVGMRLEAYNSDELAQREWIAACENVAFSDALFYYRRDNECAITRTFTTRNLYRPLTDARLLELAIRSQLSPNIIQEHRNVYYQNLWWSALYMLLHQNAIPAEERIRLKDSLSKAHRLLHKGVKLDKWYYRLSSLNVPMFWIVLNIKYIIAKNRE